MSASRPPRCLLSIATPKPMARPIHRRRNFHTSPNLFERRRPKPKSVKAEDMGLVQPLKPPKSRFADITKRKGRVPLSLADGPLRKIPSAKLFKPYSEKEKEALAKRYTAEQLRVIEVGEKAVRHEDLKSHGMIRSDPYGLPYFDDFSRYNPQLDLKRKPEGDGLVSGERLMSKEQQMDVVKRWLEDLKTGKIPSDEGVPDAERPTELDLENFESGNPFIKGEKPDPLDFELDGEKHVMDTFSKGKPDDSATNYAIPKFEDPKNIYKQKGDGGDEEGVYDLLKKQTKMDLKQILGIRVKVLVQHRVVNQTRLGKLESRYVLAIAGNGRGLLGIGEAKSTEGQEAQKKARLAAIRNLKPVPMYEKRTIFGDVYAKVSATEVNLFSRPPGKACQAFYNVFLICSLLTWSKIGFGLRVQHNIFEMARAAGLQDLSARVPRSRNKMNVIKAAYEALMSQRIPDEIARGRGKKLVDVRKVYYAGLSPA